MDLSTLQVLPGDSWFWLLCPGLPVFISFLPVLKAFRKSQKISRCYFIAFLTSHLIFAQFIWKVFWFMLEIFRFTFELMHLQKILDRMFWLHWSCLLLFKMALKRMHNNSSEENKSKDRNGRTAAATAISKKKVYWFKNIQGFI